MEYELVIACDECTVEARKKDKYWPAASFSSLTEAVAHIEETKTWGLRKGHNITIELEIQRGSEYD